ncbi:MAG TPA: RNA 2',3'-cyclic phosphodiesterase [Bacteroidales bacterium]|nr:RNA 2',3'-cyclic phosphodiesterase [Bacteroidales bacterium]
MTHRLFCAINLAQNEALVKAKEQLLGLEKLDGLNWVPMHNLHLTLRFLGKVQESKITQINYQLRKATVSLNPFSLQFKGLGSFSQSNATGVLWMGIETNPNLQTLYLQISQQLQQAGFPLESRAFAPHITIGRFRAPLCHREFYDILALHRDRYFGQVWVSQIQLMESKNTPKDVVYEAVETFNLNAEY